MVALEGIGALLVSERRRAGITQRELGERVGVRQQQVARWERTEYGSATLERVEAVARALDVEPRVAEDLPVAAEERAVYEAAPPGAEPEAVAAIRRLGVSPASLAAFARSHGIARLELFGSVLTRDFGDQSDVDVLATYEPGRTPTLMGAADQELELGAMLRRRVDLVSRAAVERGENVVRRRAVLDAAKVLYGAG
jgi:predicted nucleotidyltransferase/DNA-binding XRE family transcriptional regulator